MKNPYFSEQNARQLALTFKSLTMQNSMEFKKELLEYIDSCNRPIYIDASFLSEIDSSGLAVLIQAKQKAKENGKQAKPPRTRTWHKTKTEKNGEFQEIFPKHFHGILRNIFTQIFTTFARGDAVAPSAGAV